MEEISSLSSSLVVSQVPTLRLATTNDPFPGQENYQVVPHAKCALLIVGEGKKVDVRRARASLKGTETKGLVIL